MPYESKDYRCRVRLGINIFWFEMSVNNLLRIRWVIAIVISIAWGFYIFTCVGGINQ